MKEELPPSQRLRHEYKVLLDEWRLKVFARDSYTCQDCKTVGGPLEAHHIRSWNKNVNLRFDPDNGTALCLLCHGKRHGRPGGFVRCRLNGEIKESKELRRYRQHMEDQIEVDRLLSLYEEKRQRDLEERRVQIDEILEYYA